MNRFQKRRKRTDRHLGLFWLLLLLSGLNGHAQPFSRTDSLHGSTNSYNSCYDVLKYDITLKVVPSQKFIQGSNTITARVTKGPVSLIQLDFFAVMQLDSVVYGKTSLHFSRDSNIFLVHFPKALQAGEKFSVKIYFNGHPPEAKHAPWDGGFVWSKDKQGTDWVGLACEGMGASCWLPCKDHLDDEPEAIEMHLLAPHHLTGVSNGKLKAVSILPDGYKQYDWKVTYPINPYNISVNIGNYVHLHDVYTNKTGKLDLNYYVLSYNRDTAMLHFKQVQGMLGCFEKHFGPYPFWNDGYKLVETPYWGMEHQSCVAYGNNYKNNKWGFDFIIIHESGHEYFGNSLSMVDAAEMWIHESFTTYSETVYMECLYGQDKAFDYLTEQRKNIKNNAPVIGPYAVYFHGREDNDIYYKGAWMLQTMRCMLQNDSLWFALLKNLSLKFQRQNVSTAQIIAFFNNYSGRNWDAFFKQYLYYPHVPVLEYELTQNGDKFTLRYRLKADVPGLVIPVKFSTGNAKQIEILAGSEWQELYAGNVNPESLVLDNRLVLIEVVKLP